MPYHIRFFGIGQSYQTHIGRASKNGEYSVQRKIQGEVCPTVNLIQISPMLYLETDLGNRSIEQESGCEGERKKLSASVLYPSSQIARVLYLPFLRRIRRLGSVFW